MNISSLFEIWAGKNPESASTQAIINYGTSICIVIIINSPDTGGRASASQTPSIIFYNGHQTCIYDVYVVP